MRTIKHNLFTLLLALGLSTVHWTVQAEGFDAKGIGPAGEALDTEELENAPTPSEAEAQVFNQDQVDQWADYWVNYAEQFSPRSYRREVMQDACNNLEETVRSSEDAAKLTACFNMLRSLQIRTVEDYHQELAENTGLDGDEKPYFCPKQHPDPVGPNGEVFPRCLPTREFGMRGAWIHTKVDNASPAHTDTHFSYEVLSGDCTISAGGVITPQPGPCVVQASERINAGLTLRSDPLELTIVEDRCLVDTPVVVTASNTQPNVGDRIQVSAAGGERVMCETGNNNYRYFATPPSCRIDENGEAYATSAGDCTFKAYAAEAVNDAYLGTLTVSFSDPESSSETDGLTLSISEQNPAAGAVVDVIVQGAGSEEVLFGASSGGFGVCGIASNGRLTTSGDVTCRISARTLSGKTGAICQTFGQGGIYPPDECLPSGYYDGVLTVDNLRNTVGEANGQGIQLVARGGGTGRTITWSLAEENSSCQVSSFGLVTASANTVCKVRAYKNGGYSNNTYCAAFGSTLDGACTVENAGGTAASDFDFSGTQTAAVGSNVTLTGLNLGDGGTAEWDLDPDTWNCYFTDLNDVGGWPSAHQLTAVKLHHRANQGSGTCRVKAWRRGFPDESVTKCFVFGDVTVSDMDACVVDAPEDTSADLGEFRVVASSNQVPADGSIEISAGGVALGSESPDSYRLEVSPQWQCQVSNFQTNLYASGSYFGARTLSSRSDEDRTCRITATKYNSGLAGEVAELCVQFGDGGPAESKPDRCD